MNKSMLLAFGMIVGLLLGPLTAFAVESGGRVSFPTFDELGIPVEGLEQAESAVKDFSLNGVGMPSLDPSVIASRLSSIRPDAARSTRGAAEAQIYKAVSPAVVLILTNEGLGSGSLISRDGLILTNWHVIEGYGTVGVIFKPSQEGQSVASADAVIADVLRVDQVSDLALLKVRDVPKAITPVSLGGPGDVMVGSDVHAIGHPTGESWTYTRGFVSQLRSGYEWVTESGLKHKSDVVQTQTPINPGNSGGPLLSSDGKLIGVNSFKSSGEALNFAVSIAEVDRFLEKKGDRIAEPAVSVAATSESTCGDDPVKSYRNDDNTGEVFLFDFDCDGQVDGRGLIPDDQSLPHFLVADTDGDGKPDTGFYDSDRDGNVDYMLVDTNGSGEPDMIGYYRIGEDEPYRWEEYS